MVVANSSAFNAIKVLSRSMAGCNESLVPIDCALHSNLVFDTTASCEAFLQWGGNMSVDIDNKCFRILSGLTSASFDIEKFYVTKKISIFPYTGEWNIDFSSLDGLPRATVDGETV